MARCPAGEAPRASGAYTGRAVCASVSPRHAAREPAAQAPSGTVDAWPSAAAQTSRRVADVVRSADARVTSNVQEVR
jgi:hypothetical protein